MPREGTSKSGQGLSGLGRVAFDYDSRGIADFAFQRPASFHDIKADFSPLVVATNDPSFHRPFAAQNLRHLASIPSVGILDDGAGIRFSLGLGFGAALGAAPFPQMIGDQGASFAGGFTLPPATTPISVSVNILIALSPCDFLQTFAVFNDRAPNHPPSASGSRRT